MDLALVPGHPLQPRPQVGNPSYYRRRTPADSALDPNASLASQFDLLRVADYHRFPAYMDLRGHRYVITIEKRYHVKNRASKFYPNLTFNFLCFRDGSLGKLFGFSIAFL